MEKRWEGKRACLVSWSALIAILVLVVLVTLLPWWNTMLEYNDQSDSLVMRITRYQQLIDRREEFEDQYLKFKQQQVAKGYLINASDPDLAAAQLQQRLKELAKEHGATLTSTQNIPAAKEDDDGKVVIRARMSGDLDAISALLYALEEGRPLLTVENVSVKSRQKRQRRTRRTKTPVSSSSYELNINLDVVGYMQGASQ
ncbi:MAG: type II secretion system protein GspM [bacterium]